MIYLFIYFLSNEVIICTKRYWLTYFFGVLTATKVSSLNLTKSLENNSDGLGRAIHLYDSEWVGFWALGFSLLFLKITNCSHKSNRDTSEAKWCMCICLVMSEVETDTEPWSRHQKHKRALNKGIGHHGNHQLAAPKKMFFALMERAFSTICPSFPSSLYPPQKEKCWMHLWSSAFHLSRFLTSCFNQTRLQC